MSDNVMQPVIESAKAVQQGLDRGDIIYGRDPFVMAST